MNITLADLKKGRRSSVAKAITLVENDPARARKLIKKIFPCTGSSVIVGITGPAGAGKSSLIDKTVVALNRMGAKPAVLAVDPTSHITGGAILGDRVRMTESAKTGAYIRSIASRGATGAISASLRNSIRVLEYAGFDPIIIESVGAGQTEVEISRIADITVVVFNPNTGDNIQAIKAGLTEIGDLYIVNKCDLPGADRLYDAVRDFIGDRSHVRDAAGGGSHAEARVDHEAESAGRSVQLPGGGGSNNNHHHNATAVKDGIVLKTSIKRVSTITKFAKALMSMAEASGSRQSDSTRRSRLDAELREMTMSRLRTKLDQIMDTDKATRRHLDRLAAGKSDPFDACDRITRLLLK